MIRFWSSIHALRGIAALIVVIHHIPQYLNRKTEGYPFQFETGAIGVDIFFVISGFVMYHSVRREGITPSKFILDRLKRVLPPYWIITILLWVATAVAPRLFQFTPTGENVIKSILFIPIYYESGLIRPVLPMGWTLHYEMLFYCTVSFFLLINPKKLNSAIGAALVLSAISAAIYTTSTSYLHSPLQVFSPLVVEFLLGTVIAAATSNYSQRHGIGLEPFILIVGGLLFIASNNNAYESIGGDRLVSWGIGGALIVLALTSLEKKISLLISNNRYINITIQLLGDASYAIYLTHGISFSISYQLVKLIPNPHWFLSGMTLLLGAILAGTCTHIMLEKPIMKLWKK